MGIETAATINQLNPAWPLDTDLINEGDNHIRMLKTMLKSQFPGINTNGFNAIILAYETELNYLSTLTSNVQTQLDNLNTKNVPIGTIIMWSGTFVTIPANYQLADGSNGTPNLSANFIFTTSDLTKTGNTGGTNNTSVISHTHDFSHTHADVTTTTDGIHNHSLKESNIAGAGFDSVLTGISNNSPVQARTNYTGDHTHIVTVGSTAATTDSEGVSAVGANIPPYIKLAYIQRMS